MRIARTPQSARALETLALSFAVLIARIKRPNARLIKNTKARIAELAKKTSTKTRLLTAARATLDHVSKRLPDTRHDAAVTPKTIKKLLGRQASDPDVRKEMNRFATEAAESLKSYATAEVDRIGMLLKKSVRESWTQEEFAGEIRDLTSITHKKANNLARNLSRRLHSRATAVLAQKSGIGSFIWIHSGNDNPRPEHLARDGKVYSFRDPPPDLPGDFPNCLCEMELLEPEEPEDDDEEAEETEEEDEEEAEEGES